MKLRVFNILKKTKVEGPQTRYCIWVQGCSRHCKGCQAVHTWSHSGGMLMDVEDIIADIKAQAGIEGVTFLGGEPFEQENQKALLPLLRKVKQMYPDKTIWSYTGFIYDRDLVPNGNRYFDTTDEMVSYLDVLVDGPFVDELKNISLSFRGSENQRVINMQETLKQHRIVLKEVKR